MTARDNLRRWIGPKGVQILRHARAPIQKEVVRHKVARKRLTKSQLTRYNSPVTLFFAPEAGIVPHFVSQCILARTLQEQGHEVLMAGCFDLYPRCLVMDAQQIPSDSKSRRDLACIDCASASLTFTTEYGLDVLDLGSLLTREDFDVIESAMANLPADLSTFCVEGCEFGKIAVADAALMLKTLDYVGVDPQVREAMRNHLRASLLSYYAMKKLIGTIDISRMVYFSGYSMLLGAVFAAQRAGIAISNVSHACAMGTNRRYPTLSPEPINLLTFRRMLEQWPNWRDLALPPERVDEMVADSLFRFTGDAGMVYSRMRSGATDRLFHQLRLSGKLPVLVAFTSSLDEIGCIRLMLQALNAEPLSREQPFADQIEWLDHLIDRAEEGGFQLVVRIHPREDGNRRERTPSDHLKLLRQRFDRPYRNVRIVWPQDTVSSYDLMEIADAGTSAWSSTSVEMARMGIPTVMAFKDYVPVPIPDVVAWSRTPEGYARSIEEALCAKPSFDRTCAATRWMNLYLFGHSVDLSDVVPATDYNWLPPYKLSASAKSIGQVLFDGKTPLDLNQRALSAKQSAGAQKAEREALLRNLRGVAWLFTFGERRANDYRLFSGKPADGKLPAGNDAAVWDEDGVCVFQTGEATVRRRSRLVERLVKLTAHNLAEKAQL